MSDHSEMKQYIERRLACGLDVPELEGQEVLALIDEVGRIGRRLCVCRDCGGQGEIYSGHSTYQGYNQPPEPDMDVCGTCGGDGVLGPVEDFEAIASERDQLKAEVETLTAAAQALRDEWQKDQDDAERYRWMRQSKHFDSPQHQVFCEFYADGLDVAIDDAMGKGDQP